MKEIFKQSFSFAQIKLFKNYSNLDIKTVLDEVETDDITDENIAKQQQEDPFNAVTLDNFTHRYVVSASLRDSVYTMRLFPKDNNRRFFYANIPVPPQENGKKYKHDYHKGPFERIKLVQAHSIYDNRSHDWFDTIKDRHIKRHYNNPFAGIKIHLIERWIKKEDDKITIKYYHNVRERNINNKYFIKHSKSITLTFNLRTGNFTAINFSKAHKCKSISFYTNTFMSLGNSLGSIYKMENILSKASHLYPKFTKEFNNPLFHYALKKFFNFKVPNLALVTSDDEINWNLMILDFVNEWIPKFIEIKKIKAPNHCNRLIKNFYPTEKYLKKNDRKLIAAILDRFKVKSNVTVKILHEHPDINMLALVRLCYLFGKDYPKYIGNVKLKFFERFTNIERGDDGYAKNVLLGDGAPKFMDLHETEKSNLIKVINDYITNLGVYDIGNNHALVDYMYDHFNMMEKVREYYPDMRLTARTYEAFSQQHIELSKIEQTIKKGYSIQYTFDEETINEIEKPIEITRLGELPDPTQTFIDFANTWCQVFTPKILKTSEEYSEEGSYMHHCVSSYINTETSMIISLRTGTDRVTCEFYVKNGSCLQARYFTNQEPPKHYKEALDELYKRVRGRVGSLKAIEKKRVTLKINGKDVIPEVPTVFPELANDFGLPL